MSDLDKDFMGQFVAHRRKLFRMIYAMVPNSKDAEDLLQQTAIVLWDKRMAYDSSRPFGPWAYGVARNVVRNFRRKQANRPEYAMSPDLVEALATVHEQQASLLEARSAALDICLDKLETDNRSLVSRFYSRRDTAQALATRLGVSRATFFRRLHKIRSLLLDCITANMNEEPVL